MKFEAQVEVKLFVRVPGATGKSAWSEVHSWAPVTCCRSEFQNLMDRLDRITPNRLHYSEDQIHVRFDEAPTKAERNAVLTAIMHRHKPLMEDMVAA